MGVRIYGVRAGKIVYSEPFYKSISEKTGGHYLQLSDFKQVFDFLMTVCYNEKGADMVQMYENEVRARHAPVHKDLDKLFGDLRGGAREGSSSTSKSTRKPASAIHKLENTPSHSPLKPSIISDVRKHKKKKKRAMVKRTKKTAKDDLGKYRVQNLPRHRREEVAEKNFLLGEMAWSKWQLVMSLEAKRDCCQKRKAGKTGYRTKQIFAGNAHKSALYEIAVQPKPGCRKFVVYSRWTRGGCSSGLNWERKLFSREDISGQIESVLKKGCDVYVRRVILKGSTHRDSTKETMKRYDYAWCVIRSERKSHRPVTKASVDISEEMEV